MTSGTASIRSAAMRGCRPRRWRTARWLPGFLLLGLWLTACELRGQPALAQSAGQVTPPDPDRPDPGLEPGRHGGGLLVPPDHLDRGMTRPVPAMPPQSTPVIHPHRMHRTPHGTLLVVPK